MLLKRTFLTSALTLVAGCLFAQTSVCPGNFTEYQSLGEGQSISCVCSAEETTQGSVWGSDRYTADSSLCRAAVHAGVVNEGGGKITVYASGSCPKFVGTVRNGVSSSDWGAYDRTFTFKKGAPCSGMAAAGGLPPCPSNMAGRVDRSSACGMECYCAADQITGSVWGSDLYTLDSSVCAAARHAGVVPGGGGAVAVFVAGRCATFKGSSRNGVESSDWGPYDSSFAFRYPLPACPDGSSPRR